MAERARRTTKAPNKYVEDVEEGGNEETKYVLRFLEQKDISKDLNDREVFLLWPDDGLWYPADVKKVELRSKQANVHYTTTDEKEIINLDEMVMERQIAFKEERKSGYRCKANEVGDPSFHTKATAGDDGAGNKAAKPKDALLEGEEEEYDEAADDPDADPDASDSDEPRSDDSSAPSADDDDDEPLDFSSAQPAIKGKASVGKRKLVRSGSRPHKRARQLPAGISHGITPQASSQAGERSTTSGRAKRQVTLSAKAQELLAAERSGWGKAGAEVRMDSPSGGSGLAVEAGEEDDVDDDEVKKAEEYERALFARLSHKPSGPSKSFSGGRTSDRNLSHQSPVARHNSTVSSSGPSDDEIRTKAVAQLQGALQKSVDESATKSPAEDLPTPLAVAQDVEKALFQLYGNAGKEYRHKFRSLIFNLKDDSNPELRSRVLHGDLPPDNLVQLSANELASKELSQWRRAKEEEAMKAAVLDPAAASKFSTAAAIASQQSLNSSRNIDWRDSTLASASPPRVLPPAREPTPEPVEDVVNNLPEDMTAVDSDIPSPATLEASKPAGSAEPDQSLGAELAERSGSGAHSTAVGARATSLGGQPSTASAASFNWANIKAQALKEETNAQPALRSAFEEEGKSPVAPISPRERRQRPDEGEQPTSPPATAEDADAYQPGDDLQEGYSIAPSTGQQGEIWEGYLSNTGFDNLHAAIDYLAGNPSFTSALPANQEVAVKGRTPLDKLAAFMHNLRKSRSRTASLGLLRVAADARHDQTPQLHQLIEQYLEKERAGIIIDPGRFELYLVPPCPLAADLFAAARQSGADAEHIPDGQLLVISIHAKELEAGSRPSERSQSSERQHRSQNTGRKEQSTHVGHGHNAQLHAGAAEPQEIRDPRGHQEETGGRRPSQSGPATSAPLHAPPADAQHAQVETGAALPLHAPEHPAVQSANSAESVQGSSAPMDLKLLEGVDLSNLASLAALLGAGASGGPNGVQQQQQQVVSQPHFSAAPDPRSAQHSYSHPQPNYNGAEATNNILPQATQPWSLPGPPAQPGLLGAGPPVSITQQLPPPPRHGYQQPQQYDGSHGQYRGPPQPQPGPVTLPPPPGYAPHAAQPQYVPQPSGSQPYPQRPITLPPPAQRPITLQPPGAPHPSSRGRGYNHSRGRHESGRGRK